MKHDKEVEAVDFRVHFQDGREPETYRSTAEDQYLWVIGMAGELAIVNSIVNTQFSVKVAENRVRTINHHVWAEVEVLREEEADDGA
jgi:hypothetical protein